MHDESPTHAVATPRGLGWYLRCAVLVLCIAPYGVLMVLLLFRPVRWALVESGRLVYGIGFAASALLVVAVIAHVVGRAGHAGEPAPIPNGHLRRTGWGVRRRAVVVAFAVLAAGGEMAMHLAATDVHRYLAAEFPHAEALYANHDIANLVGQTVRVMLLKVRELVSENSDREILSAIAEVVPQAWRRLAEEQDQRIVPLTERELWVFVENPRQPALDIPRWGGLLDDWARAARVSALTEQGRRHVIRELSLTFAVSLREALKHDYEHGGKAWAAMQLDIMGELLRRSAAGAPMDDAAVKRALVDVSASISALDAIVARVRLEQTRYHEEVIVRFDNVRETLARIEKGVRALLAQGDAIQQMMLVQANPGLRQEEKLAQMLALSEGRPKELKRDPEPLQLPADLREFVERASAHASLIDQHRAKVLLGDLGAADRIAEQIEEMRRQGREQEDYMYFVTRGERFWAAEDYDSAADWFRRAVRIRGDDPRVLNSLALSLLRAKRSATYGADLTEAETWLEQALEVRQQLFPGGHPDVATSLGNVAFCLQSLGRSAEALPKFEAALEMCQRLFPGDHPDVASEPEQRGRLPAIPRPVGGGAAQVRSGVGDAAAASTRATIPTWRRAWATWPLACDPWPGPRRRCPSTKRRWECTGASCRPITRTRCIRRSGWRRRSRPSDGTRRPKRCCATRPSSVGARRRAGGCIGDPCSRSWSDSTRLGTPPCRTRDTTGRLRSGARG